MHPTALLLIAQSLTGQSLTGVTDGAGKDLDFDLAHMHPRPSCAAGAPNDIVVCAKPDRPDPNRLGPLPDIEIREGMPLAETRVFGNVKGAIVVDSKQLGPATSNRVMIRLSTPF